MCRGRLAEPRSNFYPRPPRGGRLQTVGIQGLCIQISIHALREEGDLVVRSTRATRTNFYPRPPRGGRRQTQTVAQAPHHFYPRPPRGGRRSFWPQYSRYSQFLSTPSARRATPPLRRYCKKTKRFLSTPSARRATFPAWHKTYSKSNFYPRPPRGGRLLPLHSLDSLIRFLSTPSARRATGFRR